VRNLSLTKKSGKRGCSAKVSGKGGFTTAPILISRNTTKRFGGLVAVDGLDIEIEERTIHSVIGPNGAGKTTFFNCITGFYKPEAGEILLENHSLVGLMPDRIVRLGIARTYQNIRLFPDLTAIENVLVGMHAHLKSSYLGIILNTPFVKKEEQEAEAEANRLLKFVNLETKANMLSKHLPYGEQRRLEIARALATRPKLLCLDEPTAGMNSGETQAMCDFIQSLRDDLGITIMLIEHQMRVVMGISEKITVLDYGKKLAEGTPDEIKNNPQVIEAYLGQGSAAQVH
jgi:branched-chain amino acid transport system ATP-binding protein